MIKRALTIGALATAAVLLVRPRGARSGLLSLAGRRFRGWRCGGERSVANDPLLRTLPEFTLMSPAFDDGTPMRPPYVDARALQPPLCWSNLPAGTVELAVIVEDIDVPLPAPLVHAVAYGIDPEPGRLAAGAIPRFGHPEEGDPAIGLGRGAGGRRFLPPTPIPGHGKHRYVFTAFALREPLHFDRPPKSAELVHAVREVAIGRGVTTGTHERE